MTTTHSTPRRARKGQRSTRRERAARQFAAWRAEGYPTRVTYDEAYRLTDGRYGVLGDGYINLASLALAVTE